ncbi:endolytic transglycosylase MltG [Pengzhenrongella sicca]|uniref:Endolytic murein transglycosylase n=1 Tax=Pengzhenrongella sicca TaxID=2819238 RepID=A0A8A4ZBQ0_9MICO|nr:endolytic transglycosylase MltG [Pengzhenrongella sicca]QTE28016.1 endolytic transglycosylase MltG [Pengzhenrongella sicca]
MSEIFLAGAPELHAAPVRSRASEHAAKRAARRRKRRRSAVAVVVALALVVGAGWFVVGFLAPIFSGDSSTETIADYPGPGHGSAQITVNSGDTGTAIGAALVEAGIVGTQKAFTDAYTANLDAPSIQPGTYELLLEMKASDAVVALLDPARRVSYKVTVPEGQTATQVYERVSAITTIPVADLAAAAADPAIGLPAEAAGQIEGWLFPATYSVEPDATAATVLAQMVAKTVSVLDAAAVPVDQRERVLIIASIAEKEVSAPEEYSKVARVIENRLTRQIPLGMDTINAYGLGKAAIDLTAEDLAADNPYNSRQILGLPPTPIGNPGEATIQAAMNPAEGEWTYFITVNLDTGETLFTDNYDEFLVGKQQYQDWLAANG